MVLRLVKIAISFAFGLYATMVALNNVQDAPANLAYIDAVISMSGVSPSSPASRAILPPESLDTLLAIILALDGFIAFLMIFGSLRMLVNVAAPARAFNRSKSLVSLGYCIAILLWFLGFVVIAGEWFLAWQSPLGYSAVSTSYSVSIIALLGLIFVNLKDEELGE